MAKNQSKTFLKDNFPEVLFDSISIELHGKFDP